MFKNTILFVAIFGLVFALTSVASAEIVHNWFWADMLADTNTIDGAGMIEGPDMYGGEFFEYPQPDGPTWSNAWFFNGGPI